MTRYTLLPVMIALALLSGCQEERVTYSVALVEAPISESLDAPAPQVDDELAPLAERLRREFPDRGSFHAVAGANQALKPGEFVELQHPEREATLIVHRTDEPADADPDALPVVNAQLYLDKAQRTNANFRHEPGQAGITYVRLGDAQDTYLIAVVVRHPAPAEEQD